MGGVVWGAGRRIHFLGFLVWVRLHGGLGRLAPRWWPYFMMVNLFHGGTPFSEQTAMTSALAGFCERVSA